MPTNETDNNRKNGPNAFTVIIIIALLLWGGSKLVSPKWTLMVCKDVMSNGMDCASFADIDLNAFSKLETCLSYGSTKLTIYPSFECGKKCEHNGTMMVCDTLCDRNGNCDK